jgi:hypothetical protein
VSAGLQILRSGYVFSTSFIGTGNEINFQFGYFDKSKLLCSQTSNDLVYDHEKIQEMIDNCELKIMRVINIKITGSKTHP